MQRVPTLAVLLFAGLVLTACGDGHRSLPSPTPEPPTFTTVPVTAAAEQSVYTYSASATDPAGSAVSYTLIASPAGATLAGSTVTWTPTTSQSRQPNQFILKATTANGGTTTQSWTVTPSGTVRVTWVNTIWTADGPVAEPHDWTTLANSTVLIVSHEGTVDYYHGLGDADGHVEFSNVPAGYYWLVASTGGELFWTSSSNVDLSSDRSERSFVYEPPPPPSTTDFIFQVTGFDPAVDATLAIDFDGGRAGLIFWGSGLWPGPLPFPVSLTSSTEWENVKTMTALEYKSAQLGPFNGNILGAAAVLNNLSLKTGGTNKIEVPLLSQPEKTLDLSVKGSAWPPLFAQVAPGTVTPFGTPYSLSTLKYVPEEYRWVPSLSQEIQMFAPKALDTDSSLKPFSPVTSTDCSFRLSSTGTFASPTILEDVPIGTVTYRDPLPASWKRYFQLCQQVTVDIPTADGFSTQKALLTNGLITESPASPVVPLVGPVENPTINGHSIFTAATIDGTDFTLKWDKPKLGSPSGYMVNVITVDQWFSRFTYRTIATLYTTKTTATLPLMFESRSSYWFVITALVNGNVNMENAPRRRSLPFASADVMSAPMTIQ